MNSKYANRSLKVLFTISLGNLLFTISHSGKKVFWLLTVELQDMFYPLFSLWPIITVFVPPGHKLCTSVLLSHYHGKCEHLEVVSIRSIFGQLASPRLALSFCCQELAFCAELFLWLDCLGHIVLVCSTCLPWGHQAGNLSQTLHIDSIWVKKFTQQIRNFSTPSTYRWSLTLKVFPHKFSYKLFDMSHRQVNFCCIFVFISFMFWY